jgi:hypothetical protein
LTLPPDRYATPLIIRWDGPENADLRRRIELAVASGVRLATGVQRAAAAPWPEASPPAGERDRDFITWGRDPEQGTWVLPGYDGGGKPISVPVVGSIGTEDYALPELQRAIRDTFRATGGAPRQGTFYGVYGKLSGTNRPELYYRRDAGSEALGTLFLYHRPRTPPGRLRLEEQAGPLSLGPGFYTVRFQPRERGMLIHDGQPLYSDMENPQDLDLTVAFVVDPLHVVEPQAPLVRFVPITRIVPANVESPLATGAESAYSAYTDIWQLDEHGLPQNINEFAFFAMSAYYRWEIFRLPPEDTAGAAELVRGASGYDQRIIRITWEKPGSYQVKCTVTVHGEDVSGRPVSDVRTEHVMERQLKMATHLELLERQQLKALGDPVGAHEQIWARSGAELLEKFEAELRDERARSTPNKAKIQYLEKVISKLWDQLYPADRSPVDTFPIHAVFMDRKTSQARPVSLFLAFERKTDFELVDGEMVAKPYHWHLIDLTYPAFYRTYAGKGATVIEALLACFHDSETSVRRTYPPGQILARVTLEDLTSHGIEVPPGFHGLPFTFETDSWQKDAFEWAALGIGVVGVVGLVASFVFPPSAALATVLVVTGIGGAALSVANIAERVAHREFDWDTETFADIANIAGAIAQVGALAAGTRASALARVVATAENLPPEILASLHLATKIQRALLLTQLGTDAANGLILGYSTYEQLRMVDAEFDDQSLKNYQNVFQASEGYRRWLQERQNRITGIFAHAVVGGTMLVVSVRSGVKGLGELRTAAETHRQLGDPARPGAPRPGPVPSQEVPPSGTQGPPARWKSLMELETAAATDPEAGQDLAWYRNATDSRLLAREAEGDPVATGLLNQRFGGPRRPYAPPSPLDPALQHRLRSEMRRYRAAVEVERRRLRAEQERLIAEGQLRPGERDPRLEQADPAEWRVVRTQAGESVLVPTDKQLRRYSGTVAVGVSDIPALHGEVFEGSSPLAFGSHDPAHPVRPPETIQIQKAHGHAEQSIGQQIHDRLAALSPDDRAAASGGTIWIHVDQEVCSACAAGLGDSERAGVLQRLSELNPDIVFIITADDTSKVIRLRAGEQLP